MLRLVSVVLWLVSIVLCKFCCVAACLRCVVEISLCCALLGHRTLVIHKMHINSLQKKQAKQDKNLWLLTIYWGLMEPNDHYLQHIRKKFLR